MVEKQSGGLALMNLPAGELAEALVLRFERDGLETRSVTSTELSQGLIGEDRRMVLINGFHTNAGWGLDDGEPEGWLAPLDENIKPLVDCCRAAVGMMKGRPHGRIINVIGLDYLGLPGRANQSLTAAAVFGLTRSLALELAPAGITVNTVVKGEIESDYEGLSEETRQELTKSIPVRRLGRPEEVAGTVAFLASEAAKYVTGQMLFVCGGKSCHFSMSV